MKALLLAAIATLARPAVAQSRPVWTFDHDEHGQAFLLFADPEDGGEGDPPSITCGPRGQVTLESFVDGEHFPLHRAGPDSMVQLDAHGRREPWQTQIRVSSGAVQALAPARSEYGGEMNGTTLVKGYLPRTSPVYRAFAASGRIRVVAYGQDAGLTPVPRRLLTRFVAACR